MHHIVVWDPENEWWEGSIIDEASTNRLRAHPGAAILPCDPDVFRRSGIGGFSKRAWGSGWPCDHGTPRTFAHMTIYTPKHHTVLHWVMRLVPDVSKAEKTGMIRLIGDTGQFAGQSISLAMPEPTHLDVGQLAKPDDLDGWTIYGKAIITPREDAIYTLALYGSAQGVNVQFLAISSVPR